ncbi:hypothetical protein [Pseudomonas mosselii]|uniref:hypothetical protein n=2 Tax=Pseudomonas TaxID=286 RepID=UPI001179D6C8|nr:hypothetical protein [Pseudomonas mosselii]
MANGFTEFLVAANSSAPRTLFESIRLVGNASSGFCKSWLAQDMSDALATSEEAFGLLDHIQNELLRHRDRLDKLPGWQGSPLQVALQKKVGDLVDPASAVEKAAFLAQVAGSGSIPMGATVKDLRLVDALNKLKHRGSNTVNFSVGGSGQHLLVFFTHGGMGRPDTISSFDVDVFCRACKLAATAV